MIVAPWSSNATVSRLRAIPGNPNLAPGLYVYYYLLWRISGQPGEENPEHELVLPQLGLAISKGEITCQKEILAFRRAAFRNLWRLANKQPILFRELRWLHEHPNEPLYHSKTSLFLLSELIRQGFLEETSDSLSHHIYISAPIVDAMNLVVYRRNRKGLPV